MTVRALLFTFVLGVMLQTSGLAQQSFQSAFDDNPQWELGIWGAEAYGKTAGENFGTSLISMAGFHASRVVYESPPNSTHHRTLEYTIELQPLFLITRRQVVYGGGLSPVGLKWNFMPRGKGRYRPYLECNGGAMFTQTNVPPGRTDTFNFTAAAGPGVMIALNRSQALSVALRYWHLSNANLGDRNPAFNTIQLELGFHWLLNGRSSRRNPGAPGSRPAFGR